MRSLREVYSEQCPLVAKAGWLKKRPAFRRKTWKNRFCVLQENGAFAYYKNGDDLDARPLRCLDLADCARVGVCEELENAFSIVVSTDKTWTFVAINAHDADAWLKALRRQHGRFGQMVSPIDFDSPESDEHTHDHSPKPSTSSSQSAGTSSSSSSSSSLATSSSPRAAASLLKRTDGKPAAPVPASWHSRNNSSHGSGSRHVALLSPRSISRHQRMGTGSGSHYSPDACKASPPSDGGGVEHRPPRVNPRAPPLEDIAEDADDEPEDAGAPFIDVRVSVHSRHAGVTPAAAAEPATSSAGGHGDPPDVYHHSHSRQRSLGMSSPSPTHATSPQILKRNGAEAHASHPPRNTSGGATSKSLPTHSSISPRSAFSRSRPPVTSSRGSRGDELPRDQEDSRKSSGGSSGSRCSEAGSVRLARGNVGRGGSVTAGATTAAGVAQAAKANPASRLNKKRFSLVAKEPTPRTSGGQSSLTRSHANAAAAATAAAAAENPERSSPRAVSPVSHPRRRTTTPNAKRVERYWSEGDSLAAAAAMSTSAESATSATAVDDDPLDIPPPPPVFSNPVSLAATSASAISAANPPAHIRQRRDASRSPPSRSRVGRSPPLLPTSAERSPSAGSASASSPRKNKHHSRSLSGRSTKSATSHSRSSSSPSHKTKANSHSFQTSPLATAIKTISAAQGHTRKPSSQGSSGSGVSSFATPQKAKPVSLPRSASRSPFSLNQRSVASATTPGAKPQPRKKKENRSMSTPRKGNNSNGSSGDFRLFQQQNLFNFSIEDEDPALSPPAAPLDAPSRPLPDPFSRGRPMGHGHTRSRSSSPLGMPYHASSRPSSRPTHSPHSSVELSPSSSRPARSHKRQSPLAARRTLLRSLSPKMMLSKEEARRRQTPPRSSAHKSSASRGGVGKQPRGLVGGDSGISGPMEFVDVLAGSPTHRGREGLAPLREGLPHEVPSPPSSPFGAGMKSNAYSGLDISTPKAKRRGASNLEGGGSRSRSRGPQRKLPPPAEPFSVYESVSDSELELAAGQLPPNILPEPPAQFCKYCGMRRKKIADNLVSRCTACHYEFPVEASDQNLEVIKHELRRARQQARAKSMKSKVLQEELERTKKEYHDQRKRLVKLTDVLRTTMASPMR